MVKINTSICFPSPSKKNPKAIIMFAAAPTLSPPCSSFTGSRSLSRESSVLDSMVMRSPSVVVFRPIKWLRNPLSLSPNKPNKLVLSALSSSKHPNYDYDAGNDADCSSWSFSSFKKEYELINSEFVKEPDFTISLPWEEVSIFIERLLKDTDGNKRLKITIMYNDGHDKGYIDRFVKAPTDAEDGRGSREGLFNFASHMKILLLTPKPEPESVKVEIKVMSRESQLCVLTEASTIYYPLDENSG